MEIDFTKCRLYKDGNCLGCGAECLEVETCIFRLEYKLKKIKEHCNETIRVMGDTGNNPYSQGRTIEAKRVLEILGEDNGN